MDSIETIVNAIRGMKAEALGENRPDVNRRLLDDMMASYKSLTHIELSDANRDRTIRMLHLIWTIKRFTEMGEPIQQFLPALCSYAIQS